MITDGTTGDMADLSDGPILFTAGILGVMADMVVMACTVMDGIILGDLIDGTIGAGADTDMQVSVMDGTILIMDMDTVMVMVMVMAIDTIIEIMATTIEAMHTTTLEEATILEQQPIAV
ncbi:hypothetical protein A9200_08515 [Maribacter hydrothermalis]|uniref:Uncharacterized protein n=1 Tax=Maribacter hydrothermalis TaxID=1836467 RepID=A0A1B7Z1A3_9FLAO|nr:hypothetical protein BTR34_12620 [Maribacter hydrothermalis]OBR36464.1 hypothetical protein A9200_08515 [Maribacter hydrothermalis]